MKAELLARDIRADHLAPGLLPPSDPHLSAEPGQVVDFRYLPQFSSIGDMIDELRPTEPVFCLRRAELCAMAAQFVSAFPGRTLYAVKVQPASIRAENPV